MNKSKLHTRCKHQRGVSMVELMIALLLGTFLMGGVLQLFSSNKTTFINMEGISQIQDNARAGLERMKLRVRMAGYLGCANLRRPDFNPNNVTTGTTLPVAFAANVLVTGTENNTNAGDTIVDGSDTVSIISSTVADTALNIDMANEGDLVRLSSNPGNFQTDDVLIITDCQKADIFRATTVALNGTVTDITHAQNDQNGDQVNSSTQLSRAYVSRNTMIMSMTNMTYTVEDTGRDDEAGNDIFSLFETPTGAAAGLEIMTGVEDMQIVYGEDTDADGEAEFYRNRDNVTNLANIVSIRLTLLLSTDRPIGRDLRPYTNLNNVVVTGVNTDRRMRRTFTTTIGLRNRSS